MVTIRVPATSANLGPGFDCLGLALDLWNQVSFTLEGQELDYSASGKGAAKLNKRRKNLLTQAFNRVYEACGAAPPAGVKIHSRNAIPPGSGLGSSAAAILAGLSGANELLGHPLDDYSLLKLGSELEGHPDNIAAALFGGLVVSVMTGSELITCRYEIPKWTIVLVTPEVNWPTQMARSVLPASIRRSDAIFNLGRVPLVVEALRNGDLNLLSHVMDDRLHQPQRLGHIPGGQDAWQAAKKFGAAALSGAGPSIIAFVPAEAADKAQAAMQTAFAANGIRAKSTTTKPSRIGIHTA